MEQGFFAFASEAQLPSSIASTHVGLLLRDPYVYYARQVLKLKSLNRFYARPSNADFGTLVHKIIDRYTRNYESFCSIALAKRFLEIAEAELSRTKPRFSEFLRQKVLGIAEEFVEFDQGRRSRFPKVWSEQAGEIELNLKGQAITLRAIADRIELSGNNMCILDYKTGGVPSISEIESGLSPQILISAIIAQGGGFKCLNSASSPESIAYAKLSSFSPYWKVTELALTPDELSKHKEGLVNLLTFFRKPGQRISITTPTSSYADYDEYKHLSRQKPA